MQEKKLDIVDEKTYRKNLLGMATRLGCADDLKQIFMKYDNLLKNCANEQEKKAIGAMGVLEVHRLLDNGYLGKGGKIEIDGKIVAFDKETSVTTILKEEKENGK